MKDTLLKAIISTDSATAMLVKGNAQEGCSSTKLRIDQPYGWLWTGESMLLNQPINNEASFDSTRY